MKKETLLDLLCDERRRCKGAEARGQHGNAVRYDDVTAVAWDLTGATCSLFGWQRARVLLYRFDGLITGRQREYRFGQNSGIAALAALQDFNELGATTYDEISAGLSRMPARRAEGLCVQRPSVTARAYSRAFGCRRTSFGDSWRLSAPG
jgi:hypothetical protein